MSQQEADSCLDMFHLAYGLPMKDRVLLHHKLQEYLDVLVAQEWESHTSEGSFIDFAKAPFREIWWGLTDFEPQTNKEQSVYEQLLDEMQKLSDGRRYRMQISKTSLPPLQKNTTSDIDNKDTLSESPDSLLSPNNNYHNKT